jgi:hypothetical protein
VGNIVVELPEWKIRFVRTGRRRMDRTDRIDIMAEYLQCKMECTGLG